MKIATYEKNENLYALMKKKDISLRLLSQFTDIPETTLSRIINNQVKNIKPKYMEAISKALDVPPYSIFSSKNMDQPLLSAIRPEDAGTIITKTLSEEESLLLYFYQASILESRKKILEKAKHEAAFSQNGVFSKEVNYKIQKSNTEFIQLSLNI